MIPILIGAMFGTIVAQALVIRRLSKRTTSMLNSLRSANDSNEELLDLVRRRTALDSQGVDWQAFDRWLDEYHDEDTRPGDDR